jgi:hypothetical protein
VLWWTSVSRCFYCILTYIPSGRCTGVVSWDHVAVLPLAFWGISNGQSLLGYPLFQEFEGSRSVGC